MLFGHLLITFKQLYRKKNLGIPSMSTVWIQIRPDVLSGINPGPDLDSKCLQVLSADNNIKQIIKYVVTCLECL